MARQAKTNQYSAKTKPHTKQAKKAGKRASGTSINRRRKV